VNTSCSFFVAVECDISAAGYLLCHMMLTIVPFSAGTNI